VVCAMPIARQRAAKHNPLVTLGNGPISTHSRTIDEKCFLGSVPRNYKRAQKEAAGEIRERGWGVSYCFVKWVD
jgi:hypothetical protein